VARTTHTYTVVAPSDGPLRQILEVLGVKVRLTAPWRVDDLDAYESRVHEIALLIRASAAGAVIGNTVGVFPAIDAAARAGVPSLWAIHESFEPAIFRYTIGGGVHPHAVDRFRAAFGSVRALIFEARQTAELYAPISSPEQIVIVDYGVDVDEIDSYRAPLDRAALRAAAGFDDEDVVVVVVGVFGSRKAQAAALAAFAELAAVHDRLHIVLVGSHPDGYSSAVEEQAARCPAPERVHIVPVVPEIYEWYAAADVLLCASDVEAVPRSILEAMAFELPVISTDVFGIADLIDDGWTGWLTRARDLEGLVGLLHLVLSMPESARRTVGARARAEVLRRHGDYSYGRVLGRALDLLLGDPDCVLTAAFASADAEGMAG
jgi:glycosyltransferase involved in cell wall biosynthesis